MVASRAYSVEADNWYVMALRNGTLYRRNDILCHTQKSHSETIVFINKNVLMQAYRQDIIKVLTFHNGVWHDAKLKYVLCVPDASVHLFSVKAAA